MGLPLPWWGASHGPFQFDLSAIESAVGWLVSATGREESRAGIGQPF